MRIFLAFYNGLLTYAVNSRNSLYYCIDSIINGFSYRPPLHLNYFSFIYFTLKESVKKIWNYNKLEFEEKLDPSSKKVIISNIKSKNKLIAEEYLEKITREKYSAILLNDAIYHTGGFFKKTAYTLFLLPHYLLIILLSPFFKNKKGFIYSTFELVEISCLVYYFRKKKYDHVITFNSFENSSNFLAHILKKHNIRTTKVCTPNPIKIHYKQVIADEFVFTSPYQKEEYEELKNKWFVDTLTLWPVYEFNSFKSHYYSRREVDNRSEIIGFYSSGFAKRNINLDNPLDDNYFNSELKLMALLKRFVKKHPQFKIKIYLHPIEKTDLNTYEECRNYYNDFFKEVSDNILFSDSQKATWQDFDSVNISVAVISTVNSERLYCGYKTLFTPLCFKEYPLDSTRLEAITVKNEDKFEPLLLKSLNHTRKEFFVQNKIEDFVFYALPN